MKEKIDMVSAFKCPVCGTLYENPIEARECNDKHSEILYTHTVYRPKEKYPDVIEVRYLGDSVMKYYRVVHVDTEV